LNPADSTGFLVRPGVSLALRGRSQDLEHDASGETEAELAGGPAIKVGGSYEVSA